MDVSREVIAVLSNLGTVQGLFLSVYLWLLRTPEKVANRLLALLLLGLSIRVGKSVLNHYLELEPWHRNMGLSGFLTVGPLLLLYGRVLLSNSGLTRRDLLHFVPAGSYFLFSAVIPNSRDLVSYVSYSFVLLQLLLYLFLSFRQSRHNKNVVPTVHQWYLNMVVGISLVWLLYVLIFIRIIPFYIGGAISYSILIYTFTYLLLKRHTFKLKKYGHTILENDRAKELMVKVEKMFNHEKLHLERELTIKQVSEKLAVPSRQLSQLINQHASMNFSEYVNSFRVEEAKSMLKDPEHMHEKIATIAYDSGFNNLTSFSQVFKADTDMTPSQYREQFFS